MSDKLIIITEFAIPKAWVQKCILATCSACSTKISLDSCGVFLGYIKTEQAEESFCWQDALSLGASSLERSGSRAIPPGELAHRLS